MLIERYYVITANAALADRIRAAGVDDEGFLEPRLWRSKEPDRSGWRPVDHLTLVKVLFLAEMRSLYGHKQIYREAVELHGLSVATFDAFWACLQLMVDDDVDDVPASIGPETVAMLKATGNGLVDGWLREKLKANT